MLGYLSAEREANSFPGTYIFAIVFIILQIFAATRAVLKIGEYRSDIAQIFPSFFQSRNAFGPITRELKYLDYNARYDLRCL